MMAGLAARACGVSGAVLLLNQATRGGSARCETLDEKPEVKLELLPDLTVKDVKLYSLIHLSELGFQSSKTPPPGHGAKGLIKSSSGQVYSKLIKEHDCVLVDIVRTGGTSTGTRAFKRAGPRAELHFEPSNAKAAIVTCGGLCPGLNDVIHHLVNTLHYNYGVREIWGIRGGYRGLSCAAEALDAGAGGFVGDSRSSGVWFETQDTKKKFDLNNPFAPVKLTPDSVKTIHHMGGTVLGSSRGGFDMEKTIEFLRKSGVNQLYIVGGDGTHRGAYKLSQECAKRGLNVAVAGIPKTIDNDIGLIDRSFGFLSAVEAAQGALNAARVEATGNMPNGIALVKLMGRSSGFLAAYATLASSDVDLCLVPEVPIVADGPNGFLPHIEEVLRKKGHAVIVVAEGAGEDVLGQSASLDAGGNRKLPAIDVWMKKRLTDYFKAKGTETTIKYIEPSYMVRSVPANSQDSYDCALFGQGAVHGTMAGFTGFTVGLVNNHTVLIPIPALAAMSPRMMNSHGRTWERVLSITHQPNTVAPPEKK